MLRFSGPAHAPSPARRRLARASLTALLLLLVASCGEPSKPDLAVDLLTDLRIPRELAGLEVQLLRGEAMLDTARHTPDPAADYGRGVRIAEFLDLEPGNYRLRLVARDPAGEETTQRTVALRVGASRIVAVVMSRQCVARSCPAEGDDPDATECLAGRCVPPGCVTGEEPECGAPQCTRDEQCAPSAGSCLGRCTQGACLLSPRDEACPSGWTCTEAGQCVERDARDAGPDASRDAAPEGGPTDAAPSDAGDAGPMDAMPPPDASPECTAAVDCDDANPCTNDTCSMGACANTPAPAGTSCSAGSCDGAGNCVGCTRDADCAGSTPFCDTASNTCVQCRSNAHCDDANPCTNDTCSGNTCSHTDVPAGTASCTLPGGGAGVCNGSGDCVQCVDNRDCGGLTPYCNAATNTCVECRFDALCNDGNPCTNDRCTTSGSCLNTNAVSGTVCPGGVCNGAGSCVECLSSAQCSDGNPCTADTCSSNTCSNRNLTAGTSCPGGVCDGAGACVECVDNGDCSGATPYCDTSTNTCVECRFNTHCDDGNPCTADTCLANTCSNTNLTAGTSCPSGVCDGTGACVECVDNGDCNDGNPCTTDTCSSNTCGSGYVPAGSGSCTLGSGNPGVCDGSGGCVECVTDAQCGGSQPRCSPTKNFCVECLDDIDCPPFAPICSITAGVGVCIDDSGL